MNIIEPSFTFLDEVDGEAALARIERAGRVCYKSEARVTSGSARKFVERIIQNGHESVLEHEKLTVKIICDRGVSHEIVRHRLASYSQESTRYCNYSKTGGLTFIRPFFWKNSPEKYALWLEVMESAEKNYLALLALGATPQEARSVLPSSLKTEIVVTMNFREWRHFFALRTDPAAHPQMREIACPLLEAFREKIPVVFGAPLAAA